MVVPRRLLTSCENIHEIYVTDFRSLLGRFIHSNDGKMYSYLTPRVSIIHYGNIRFRPRFFEVRNGEDKG